MSVKKINANVAHMYCISGASINIKIVMYIKIINISIICIFGVNLLDYQQKSNHYFSII